MQIISDSSTHASRTCCTCLRTSSSRLGCVSAGIESQWLTFFRWPMASDLRRCSRLSDGVGRRHCASSISCCTAHTSHSTQPHARPIAACSTEWQRLHCVGMVLQVGWHKKGSSTAAGRAPPRSGGPSSSAAEPAAAARAAWLRLLVVLAPLGLLGGEPLSLRLVKDSGAGGGASPGASVLGENAHDTASVLGGI